MGIKNTENSRDAIQNSWLTEIDKKKRAIENKFKIEDPKETCYEAEVPDTLDLAEMAALTVLGITNRIDPEKGYMMYTRDNFYADPPHMHFLWANEGGCEGKHLEGLPLLRMISGSDVNRDQERGFWENILQSAGEDGCFYLQPEMYKNPGTPSPRQEPHTGVEREGRHILALCMRCQLDPNPAWKALIEKKINRLRELAVYRDNYAYFTFPSCTTGEVSFTPEDTAKTAMGTYKGGQAASTNHEERITTSLLLDQPTGGRGMFEIRQSAHQVHFMLTRSLCVYYRISGHAPALELAGKIVRGILEQQKGFEPDGRWLIEHFHTATASLLAILEYAIATEDRQLIAFVDRCYQFGKISGDAVTGYFPEYRPGAKNYLERRLCETCEVADMIGLAIKLTLAGAGDYWGDVERWTRNQLVENQLTSEKLATMQKNFKAGKQPVAPPKIEWMQKLIDGVNRQKAQDVVTELQIDSGTRVPLARPMKKDTGKGNDTVPEWASLDIQRAVGSFSGWASPNDWGAMSMHGCCTGNASRTIYWIWDSIVTLEKSLVTINLLMNRVSPWLDVDSYLPYQGRVVLRIKDAATVAVRIPEWTDRKKVSCTVGGADRSHTWSRNYIVLSKLKGGDVADIRFPIPTETLFRVIGADTTYKLTVKGYTVVDMDPKGPICPSYGRDAYKGDTAPIKKVTRIVPAKTIIW